MSFSSPPAKKALFGSPNKSPSVKKNITGWLTCSPGVQTFSHTNNAFFDVQLRTAANKFEVVRVMDMGLVDKAFFTRQLNQVVRLKNVTEKINNGHKTTFYNEKWGSLKEAQGHGLSFQAAVTYTNLNVITEVTTSLVNVKGYFYWTSPMKLVRDRKVREAVLCGLHGRVRLDVWAENVIKSLGEGQWYAFHVQPNQGF